MIGNKKDKPAVKREVPVVNASFDELHEIKQTVTLSGDVVAVLQNCLTLSIKQKGLLGMAEDTNTQAVFGTLETMSKLSRGLFNKANIEIPEDGKIQSQDLKDLIGGK